MGDLGTSSTRLPQDIQDQIETLPKLTKEQCGHLRHFWNLATTLDGDWGLMGSSEPRQEYDTALRYQISHMAYATGAAHYHRQPVVRSMYKELLERLIAKMMRPEVWAYWYLASQSGIKLNPDLKELRKPWADPVCRENIMYSGHLLCMVSLYTMLFQDHRFDEIGSIQFDWNPLFFGMGRETFKYSRHSLQQTILEEMERNKWMGVCCEPNLVFVICNQFPMIAMRYNDATDGKHVIDDILPKYRAAWAKKGGLIGDNGLFKRWYAVEQDAVPNANEIGHSAWTMSYMPWNFDQVQKMFRTVGKGYIHRLPERTNIHPGVVAVAIKKIIDSEGGDENDSAVIERARAQTAHLPRHPLPYGSPVFGYVAQWFSEIGGLPELQPLLAHADAYLNPTWRDGGLYYKRNDAGWDEDGNYLYSEPYTGNAAIGYSRLNVQYGQKKMWDHPWTKADVGARPWVDGLSFGDGVDCVRGHWDSAKEFMVLTLRTWAFDSKTVEFGIKNLPNGNYRVYEDSTLLKEAEVSGVDDKVMIEAQIESTDTDIVVVRSAQKGRQHAKI